MRNFTMKIPCTILILMFILGSCETEKLDERIAQNRVEALFEDISKNNHRAMEKHFTLDFNKSEPVEQKIEKYQQLKRVLGPFRSMELISSVSEANFGEDAKVFLEYRITYRNATTIENFEILKDEGEYRIARHHIKNE